MLKKNILLTLLLAIAIVQTSFAGWLNISPARIGAGASTQCASITKNDIVRNYDPYFASVHSNPSLYFDNKVVNRVVLGINRDCTGPFTGFTVNSPYELEVDVYIEYLDYAQATSWLGSGGSLGNPCGAGCTRTNITKTLKIKYDPNYQTTETELSIFEFSGGYDVEVTILDIRLNGTTINMSPSPNNVYIENIIAIERFRDLDLGGTTTLSPIAGTIGDEEVNLTINTPILGAENYDIEWTYLDWHSGHLQLSGDMRFAFDFKNNASRITIKDETAQIPIIYSQGIILFRARANGFIFPNISYLESSSWFGQESGIIDVDPNTFTITPVSPTSTVYGYYIAGYSKDITWQHSVSFAEEGKRKQVISYFDGSLYNRQSVTKNNSDNKAIVGQSIYDFNGRPAVQLLPTPVPSINNADQNLAFKPNFNQTNQASRAGKTYNYLDFDLDALNCSDSKTSKLSNGSGAEKYYSVNNPFTDGTGAATDAIHRDRIPKANGYAFTQTEYMPDNTGRVRRQGGVGEAHRLTGENETGIQVEGKETKYHYGIPNQTELYRMFANEAGDANRYKKNIVIDPNGQVSISYLDPMGRVVATSLAGDPANSLNMDPVAGRNAVTTTIDISQRNTRDFTDMKISSEYDQFVVNDNSTYTFSYRLAVPMLNYQCGATTFCYDCVYDITLSVVDECGNELVPVAYRSNKVGINPPQGHECGVDSIVFDDANSFQLILNQGSYKIKKVVSIDRQALNDYIDNLLASPDISDCITSFDDLVTQEKAKLDYTNCDYTCAKCSTDNPGNLEVCNIFCNQTTPCDALYQQMLIDMSPGGQYFDNLPQDATYESNIKNDLADDLLPSSPDNTWLNANDGAFSSFFGVSGTLTSELANGVTINTWTDVRENWIDEFAGIIVEMHPEYCIYQKCSTIMAQDSYKYDEAMRTTTTAAEAIANGYYNPTNMTIVPANLFPNASNKDPFFENSPGSGYKTNMENSLTNYEVNFDEDDGGPIPAATYNLWGFIDYWVEKQGSDIQGCLTDYGWTMFRAGYLAKKQEQLNAFYASTNICTNATFPSGGFKRRFYYADAHDDDDFTKAFTQAAPGGGSNEAAYNTFTKQEIEAHCEKTCSTYIDQWKRELAGCNLSQTDMDNVIAKLLAVCEAGCDAYDPLGSRYAKPGTTSSVEKSFKEVLDKYTVLVMGNPEPIYNPGVCDDLLIQWPKGSYHDMWAELTPYANRCTCLPNQQAPTPANTCATCGESLTNDGFRLKENLELAEKEKCKNCITCVNLANGLKELDERYNTTFTPDDANKRIIMENYFNLKFSFNLTYLEYIDFMRDCAGDATITDNTVANFRADMKKFVDPDPIVYSGSQQMMMMGGGGPQTQQETLESPDSSSQSPTAQTFTIGGLDSTEGFGLGGGAMAMSAPSGLAPLDKCGCEKLLQQKTVYDDYVLNPLNYPNCAPGKTFTEFMNDCSGECEGAWTGLDADYIWQACKDAVDKDLDNAYSGVGFVWSEIQLQNLNDFVDFDNNTTSPKLYIPEDCDCTTPPNISTDITETEVDCDPCILDALDKALKANAANLKIDGVAVTEQQMKDFLQKKVLREVVTNYDAQTNTYSYEYIYSKCMFYYPWTNPNYYNRAEGWEGVWDYIKAEGCIPYDAGIFPPPPPPPPPPPCPTNCPPTPPYHVDKWPFGDPPVFCNTCYEPNTALLTQSLDFLNQLKELYNSGRPQAGNILTSSGWMVDPAANKYIGAPLYSASCSSNLKYTVEKWFRGSSANDQAALLTFKITDVSGGGSCTHTSRWTLTFPEYDADYRFNYIIEFTEILPAPRKCEENTNSFWVGVKVRKPDNTSVEVKYVYATVSNQYFYTEDAANCKTLCNKPILPKVEATDPCVEFLDRVAESNAAILYEQQIKDLRTQFTNQYIQKCMSVYDYFNMDYQLDEYHYTLYYYDQADNLIKTVPPKGVTLLANTSVDSCYVYDFDPQSNPRILPNHNYITNYKYNTLNQLVQQTTPDAGTSKFWYDRLGRIVLSQNAKQLAQGGAGRHSYTTYDNLGRIIEVGQIDLLATVTAENTADPSWVQTNIVNSQDKEEITRTFYDAAPAWQTALSIQGFTPTNLRNRVVATCYYLEYEANDEDYQHATHYSYDILGNVHHLVQDFPQLEPMGQRYKNIKYNYDLASGNVNLVSYQPGEIDQLYHYYTYDADNRITEVRTARRPAISEIDMARDLPTFTTEMGWQNDAKYFYYLHGPLARMELGNHKVQGTDYSYTLHGWLKAMNDGFMQNTHDPGKDGYISGSNHWNGRDAIGFELGYYSAAATLGIEDYNAIGNNGHISTKTGSNYLDAAVSLYNGNISQMVTTLPDKTQLSVNNLVIASPRGANYRYDQLNRIKESVSFTNAHIPNHEWNNNLTPGTIPQEWYSQYSYDAMGNITTLKRQDGTGGDMDDLTYHYDVATPSWKNQLLYVDDSKAAGLHTEDIDDQSTGNYAYDEIGNLIQDNAEEIQNITWTVRGKIKGITRTGASTKPNLAFEYNAVGQRVVKHVIPNNGDKPTKTFYLRDASGNIMATYKLYIEIIDIPTNAAEERLVVEEWNLYGSSRLGVYSKEEIVANRIGVWNGTAFVPGDPPIYTINGAPAASIVFDEQVGFKNYELTNHLGNVLATVTDRKVPSINGTSYDYFNAQITSITDYYPFGMQIEERSWVTNNNGYRFGFNGQEKENDISGNDGDNLTFTYRMHDARLGRFLSVDPLAHSYPDNSTYAFAQNSVTAGDDLEGGEFRLRIFSPELSSKFQKAASEDDVLRQKELTWYAINSSWKDSWAQNLIRKGSSGLGEMANKPGVVTYDPTVTGFHIEFFDFTRDDNGNIISIDHSGTSVIAAEKSRFFDKNWPIDIRSTAAYQEHFSLYRSYYSDDKGNAIDLRINAFGYRSFSKSTILFNGYLRGFGYVEGSFQGSGSGLLSFPIGGLYGKYMGEGVYKPRAAFNSFVSGFHRDGNNYINPTFTMNGSSFNILNQFGSGVLSPNVLKGVMTLWKSYIATQGLFEDKEEIKVDETTNRNTK
jgi:RHS repeat-associated protein